MKTLVVGLGNIGLPIAVRLSGVTSVVAVDPDPARLRAFAGQCPEAETVGHLDQAVWSEIDRAVIVVRQSEHAVEVARQVDSRAVRDISVHVHTTLSTLDAASFSSTPWQHARMLEQPVSGGASGAEDGTLVVLSAGPSTPADDAVLLAAHAGHIIGFEEYGQPSLAKLMNNTAAAFNLEVAAWLVAEAADHGVSASAMLEVIQRCSGGSWMAMSMPELAGEQVALLAKDVELLTRSLGPVAAPSPQDGARLQSLVASVQRAMGDRCLPE